MNRRCIPCFLLSLVVTAIPLSASCCCIFWIITLLDHMALLITIVHSSLFIHHFSLTYSKKTNVCPILYTANKIYCQQTKLIHLTSWYFSMMMLIARAIFIGKWIMFIKRDLRWNANQCALISNVEKQINADHAGKIMSWWQFQFSTPFNTRYLFTHGIRRTEERSTRRHWDARRDFVGH